MGKDILEKKIEDLMKEWVKYCHSKWPDDVFVKDGAFPFYEEQKTKVLFIGRELYGRRNDGDGLTISYWDERAGMDNLGVFQSRLLYLAYGIENRQCSEEQWKQMRNAKELNCIFAESKKRKGSSAFSYAFMNASKLLNTEGTHIGNKFSEFIDDEKNRYFIIREIELLAPHIIVSGNLGDIGFMGKLISSGKVKLSSAQLNNQNRFIYIFEDKKIPWIDTWHFSARKADFEGFYEPVCGAAEVLLGERERSTK